jgi:hypothetical protein
MFCANVLDSTQGSCYQFLISYSACQLIAGEKPVVSMSLVIVAFEL